MASKEAYNRLLKKGYPWNICYNSNDALESDDDVQFLMEVLSSVKDKHGKPAKFTLNNVVANPDFTKIKETDYQRYFFEPFTETLKRYDGTSHVLDLYKSGISNRVFQVQFHGREHININRWLSALRSGKRSLKDAFEENMYTINTEAGISGRLNYLDSFGEDYDTEVETLESILKTGMSLFNSIWNFTPKSFIAPCYIWPSAVESILREEGIKYIQGSHVQLKPFSGTSGLTKKYHYQGQLNKSNGLRYLVRNSFFEPTPHGSGMNEVDIVLNQIARAFKNGKPAIVSTHRVNFVGRLNIKNRDSNLRLLEILLKKITKIFPDVKFMSSDELGDLIGKNFK